MKTNIRALLSLIAFAAALSAAACNPVVSRSTDSGEGGDGACPEPVEIAPPAVECPARISVDNCTITHPQCPEDRPHERYYTHGAHSCEEAYPPLHCEYVGDVTCEGATLGTWCCK